MEANFGVDQVRLFLHLLGATVWLGGQIVMLGILPVLRSIGGDAPKQVAGRFGALSWPFFGLTVVTGIWNMLEVEGEGNYAAVLGIKMLVVLLSGAAAFVHQRTDNPGLRGATGGIGFLTALLAMYLGLALSH